QKQPFGVLTKHHKVNSATAILERREIGMQQPYGTEIDVEIEPKPEPQENVARVLVPRNARVAHGTQKNRVYVITQVPECGFGKRFSGSQIVVGAERQALPLEYKRVYRRHALEDRHCGCDDFRADAVTANHRNAIALHSKPVERPQLAQYAQPTSTSLPHAGQRSSPDGG